MKKSMFFLTLLASITVLAQTSNIFLERSFWKTNPSITTIEQKIAEGNIISALNSNAFDAVVYALLENVETKTIIHLLSKKGNDVNKLTHDGRTYIFWAAYKDNLEILEYVVSKGAKTNLIDSHGYSVLNFAATTGQINMKLYDYLFEKTGANIKVEKNNSGANALLLIAPFAKDFTIIDYLISKGASLTDKDDHGNGFFEYAAKGGNISFLKTLLEKDIDKGKNAMIFASQGLRRKKNTLETYKFLENVGVKANIVDKKGRNPLHAIAYDSKDLSVYKYFIDKGVATNLQDNNGNSPFMNAANNNTLEVVTFLSKNITDINSKNEKGCTALTMAIHKNSIEVVAYLIENGADVNIKDHKENTLSFYLLKNYSAENPKRFEEKLKVLIENGFTMNTIQNSGNTLLHIATERNNLALLKRLESFHIDINAKNTAGFTALQIAAMKSNDDSVIKYLLSKGADKNVKTDFNESIYDLASENELLKKKNINITFLK